MDKIIIKDLPNIIKNGKVRLQCLVECPDCNKQRTIRKDSFKNNETTCCRSCLNLRRPTKPEENLFNWQVYYRTKQGKIAHMYQAQKQRCKEKGWEQPTYLQNDLIEWALAQPKYHILFDNWVNSGYQKSLSPSIDRLNDYISYTLKNIQLMTWQENNDKGRYWQVIGLNTKNCIGVAQYDKENNLLNTYHSISNASKETSLSLSGIAKASDPEKEQKTCGGYVWKRTATSD